jgi:hypothetical protein
MYATIHRFRRWPDEESVDVDRVLVADVPARAGAEAGS